ncbi:MAG TPA: rhomboid family intramembrane serine protease, partial [Myxococcales bacterium]|nr:rhomboid family intramembrane serine protease [Myxococcales bacterium]
IFALVSFITAMGSATLSLLLSFDVHMLGASGMILGWGGAILPIATEQGRRSIGTWLVQVAIISFIPGVSWQGHLGGFLFGVLCGLLLKLGRPTFWKLAPFLAIASVGTALLATHSALHPGV